MNDILHPENEFLRKVVSVTESHLSNEQFGVSELAGEMSMSRNSLLRKVKRLTGTSVSVYMRTIRLHHARQLLSDDTLTVSEVAYSVGFSSTSYFTKCFREEFGYTPGEEKRIRQENLPENVGVEISENKDHKLTWVVAAVVAIVCLVVIFILVKPDSDSFDNRDKTIAVLPFVNNSDDSTNVYIINGLMDAILSNLQKVEELKVSSRTSVEKYRKVSRTIREISEELDVNYFVEGSGQKIGNKIVLTVQLIDASSDSQIWSRRYERDAEDIFQLQMDVARNIADEIEVVIKPEEEERIAKIPTENLKAYDFYLKGMEFSREETGEGLRKAIDAFNKAVAEDPEFAHAYAYLAICYYYLDLYQTNRTQGEKININADKALLLDPEIAESQFAKGLSYMHQAEYERAVPYFEKALEYSPNYVWIHNFLSDIYTSFIPDTGKYLKHALQGIRTAVASQDSVAASFSYLHLSNALVQTGFVTEGEEYNKKSLALYPGNVFSRYLQAYIDFAGHSNMARTREDLTAILKLDTTRLDILQELGKLSYTMKDYDAAAQYYTRFIKYKRLYQLNIYPAENLKIGYVFEQTGRQAEADSLYREYSEFAATDESLYRNILLSTQYAVEGDIDKGMEYLKAFSSQKDFVYWLILFLDKDPILNLMSDHPEYKETMRKITDNFWQQHRETRKMLMEEGVILG